MQLRKKRARPEDKLANELRRFMENRGWCVEKTHGSMYQSGWPDFLCMHSVWGTIWIENKSLTGKLRPSQITKFLAWEKVGAKIFVCRGLKDYHKIFEKPNWGDYI